MNPKYQHSSLAAGRWATFTLMEQLANVGSEVGRALRAKGDQVRFDNAVSRGLELFDLTIADARWHRRRKELTRMREAFCDAVLGGIEYGTTLEDLDKYFYYFAFAARASR